MICYIFGAGEMTPCNLHPKKEDLILAADGGLDYLTKIKLSPDLIIGDLDSVRTGILSEPCLSYPPEKDDTDMMLSINYGLSKGYKDFQIYGGLGGRLDHTIANIQLLAFLSSKDARGVLVGPDYRLTAITDESITISGREHDILSVLSLTDICNGVTLESLKYPLKDAVLTNTYPLGISNQFTKKPAKISVKKGTLAILWSVQPYDT